MSGRAPRRVAAVLAVVAAVVGLLLVASAVVQVGTGSLADALHFVTTTGGALLVGVGLGSAVLLRGAARPLRQALLLTAAGLVLVVTAVLLARISFIPRGEAVYVPLGSPQLFLDSVAVALELVLIPALAVTGVGLVLTALIGALATGARISALHRAAEAG